MIGDQIHPGSIHPAPVDPDSGVTLLDGGMGQELIRRGQPETVYWSCWALLNEPGMVRRVHDDFIAAGADIITTNTYATFRDRFERGGLPGDPIVTTELGGRLARAAADAVERDVLVAGSLPPMRNSYNPAPDATRDELYREYVEHIGAMEVHVDLIVCETMGALHEADAAAAAGRQSGKPVWVAFTLQGGTGPHLLDGSSFAEAVEAAPADVYLLNCCSPEQITEALPLLVEAADGRPVGAYANAFHDMPLGWSGRQGDPLPGRRDDMGTAAYVAEAERWLELGATIIGGCCEFGPEHIAALHEWRLRGRKTAV